MLAAGVLGLFAAAMGPLKVIPADEYVQLERAPAWIAVGTGIGMAVLACIGSLLTGRNGAQIFIGWPGGHAALMVDAYTLWASALLGMVLAVAAWIPAARRSLVPRALPYFVTVLLLVWLAQNMLCGVQLGGVMLNWLFLLAGSVILWAWLMQPQWCWEEMEPFVVLLLAGIVGSIGLVWLRGMIHGSDLTTMWSQLLSTNPRAMNIAVLLAAVGWLGPAVYLPWWLWTRRQEPAMVWLPAGLTLGVAGVLTLVRLVFFLFPAGGGDFSQLPGVEHLFLIKRLLAWMLAWGVLSLLLGTGWLALLAARRRARVTMLTLRPVILVGSGMLILGIAGGLLGVAGSSHAIGQRAISGLLWQIFTWAGFLATWLAVEHLSPVLPAAGDERRVLTVARWMSLAALVGIPPFTGFRVLTALWTLWQQYKTPPQLIILALALTAVSTTILLLRKHANTQDETPREGAEWGVIGPFAFAFLLLASGILAGPLSSLMTRVCVSLLQAY